eukprot:IDg4654t1
MTQRVSEQLFACASLQQHTLLTEYRSLCKLIGGASKPDAHPAMTDYSSESVRKKCMLVSKESAAVHCRSFLNTLHAHVPYMADFLNKKDPVYLGGALLARLSPSMQRRKGNAKNVTRGDVQEYRHKIGHQIAASSCNTVRLACARNTIMIQIRENMHKNILYSDIADWASENQVQMLLFLYRESNF